MPTVFDDEIERILKYPREASRMVVEKNKGDIVMCLKYYNAFDDWGQILSFLGKATDGRDLRTWELFLESDINMETALIQSIHGLYKSSLMSLRSCFETALLMVFYSYPEKDAQYDQYWDGRSDSPRFGEVRSFLFSKDEFKGFDDQYKLQDDVKKEYQALSGYIHTRGYERFEMRFRTPKDKRTQIFGDYLGFDPNFMKEIAAHLSTIFEIFSTMFGLRFRAIKGYFQKPKLVHGSLENIIATMPTPRLKQLLDYYGVDQNLWGLG